MFPFSDEEAVRLIEMEPPQKRRSNAPVIRHEDSIPTLMTIYDYEGIPDERTSGTVHMSVG